MHAATRHMAGVARKALGRKETWTATEGEAVRRMIAGDMPVPSARQEGKAAKRMEIAVATAVRQLQHAVAEIREAWRRASAQEMTRRREESMGEALRGGVMWRWAVANKTADKAKDRIWGSWRRHRARVDWEERVTVRKEERRQRQEEVEGNEEHARTEAWQGRDTTRMRGELRGEKRGKMGEEGPEGWTMAAALIMYKKGIQRKEDMEKVRQAREERAGRERARQEKGNRGEHGNGGEEATDARTEATARTENKKQPATGTGDELTEEENAQIEDRVREMYAGLVNGMKKVLLGEVARYAIREYHGIGQGEEETREGGHAAREAREAERRQREQGSEGTHEEGEHEATSRGQRAEEVAAGQQGEEPGAEGRGGKRARQRREGEGDERESRTEEGQAAGPHEGQEHGRDARKRRKQEVQGGDTDGGRGTRARGKEGARTREDGTRESEGAATRSMRGQEGAHGEKRQRTSGHERGESGETREEGRSTRARGSEREEEGRIEGTEEENTTQEGSMRPTRNTRTEQGHRGKRERSTEDEDEEDEAGRTKQAAAATPQYEDEEEQEQPAATQQSIEAAEKEKVPRPAQTVNRPKRTNRGQPVYFTQEKKRKVAAQDGRRKKGAARIRYIDNGSGKGKVALEQTVAVGRVYMERMEQQGDKDRDTGRPPGDPG